MNRYYSVEEIIGRRQIKGKHQYLIKWKGYSISESTLEPEKNLENIKDLINEYNNSLLNKKEKEINNDSFILDGEEKNDKNKDEEEASIDEQYPYYIVGNSIKKILGICDEDGILYAMIEILKNDGKLIRKKIRIEELKMNNPWLLIDYYESKIKFI